MDHLGSRLTQNYPECLVRFNRPGGEFLTRLRNFTEPRSVRLVAFRPYEFNLLLVGGAPVVAWNDASLPLLKMLDERPQAAPFVPLLLCDLRCPPLYERVEVGVIAPEIVNSVEKGVTILVQQPCTNGF